MRTIGGFLILVGCVSFMTVEAAFTHVGKLIGIGSILVAGILLLIRSCQAERKMKSG